MNKRAILIRNAAATDFGGGERVPVWFARELSKHGISPIVFSRNEKLLAFADLEGVPYKRTWWWSQQNWSGVRALLFPIYLVWQIVLFFYYLFLFIAIRPNIVHVQSKDDFTPATLAARSVGARVIWSDHADLKHIFKNHSIWYKNPIGKLVYWAARFTYTIIIVGKEDQRLIHESIPEGIVREKLQIVYNGAFDVYKQTPKNKQFTFISTGRLVTDKGITELVTAFKQLKKEHKNIQLQLVGDGPERKKFEKLAKGTKDITFFGYQQDPQSFLAKADVYLLPTYHEGFSLALVEACMQGLAIIATDIGGNPEIIVNKKNGLLVPIKDSDAVYQAMKTLYEDEKQKIKLGKAARKTYSENFNYEKLIETKILPLYERS